jgi:hypothetical protein
MLNAQQAFRNVMFSCIVSILPIALASGQEMDGTWSIVPSRSTDQATWRYSEMQLDLRHTGDRMIILHQWIERRRVALVDSFSFVPGGGETRIPVHSPVWSGNWYMGVLAKPGSEARVTGTQGDSLLSVQSIQPVLVSQGEMDLTTTWNYSLSRDTLTVREQRATRPTPVILTFVRSAAIERGAR